MEWWPGILIPVGALAAALVWALRYEAPRLNRKGERLAQRERLFDWRQRQIDEIQDLWQQYFRLVRAGRLQEAQELNDVIRMLRGLDAEVNTKDSHDA